MFFYEINIVLCNVCFLKKLKVKNIYMFNIPVAICVTKGRKYGRKERADMVFWKTRISFQSFKEFFYESRNTCNYVYVDIFMFLEFLSIFCKYNHFNLFQLYNCLLNVILKKPITTAFAFKVILAMNFHILFKFLIPHYLPLIYIV